MTIWSLLARAAAEAPDAVAVRSGAVHSGAAAYGYAELERRATTLAHSLSERAAPGERVAILAHNGPEYLCAYFAAARAGLVLVPCNTRLTAHELGAILADCDARAILHDDAMAATAGRLGIPTLALRDSVAATTDAATTAPPAAAESTTPAHLYYTSGTTGTPKGVVLTHGNVLAHVEMVKAELGLASRDVWGHIAPMFHLADAWAVFAITDVRGAHAFVPEFSPQAAFTAIERDAITMSNLVPTMLQRMLAEPAPGATLASLRTILSGGAPIAPQTVRAIVERFGCEYVQTYGMTETSPFLTMSLLDDELRALDEETRLAYRAKTGRPVRGVELRVVDANGQDVPRDETTVGEIVVRGPTVTPGYWQQPDATRAAIDRDGWLHTGDLAVIERRGFVTIVDRAKDTILTGGETVYSTEVENRLFEHPAVVEAAVVGVPDDRWGERVVAAVVVHDRTRVTPDEMIAFAREALAGFKTPKEIRFLDALPRTGSGKISKRTLRDAW